MLILLLLLFVRVGVHSHFPVQPNYSVEVVLCCRWGCDKTTSKSKIYGTAESKQFLIIICHMHLIDG